MMTLISFCMNDVELLVPKLLDDEEFDFDLPISPVPSEQYVDVFTSDSIYCVSL